MGADCFQWNDARWRLPAQPRHIPWLIHSSLINEVVPGGSGERHQRHLWPPCCIKSWENYLNGRSGGVVEDGLPQLDRFRALSRQPMADRSSFAEQEAVRPIREACSGHWIVRQRHGAQRLQTLQHPQHSKNIIEPATTIVPQSQLIPQRNPWLITAPSIDALGNYVLNQTPSMHQS